MATVKKIIPAPVKVPDPTYEISLSCQEASALLQLLGTGVECQSLTELGLECLFRELRRFSSVYSSQQLAGNPNIYFTDLATINFRTVKVPPIKDPIEPLSDPSATWKNDA